jgi:hypothetical protein
MIRFFRSILASMVLFVLVAPEPTAAQQPKNVPETKSAAPYHLGLGELMTAFVQPRHIKLGLAGKEQPRATHATRARATRRS